MLNLLSFDSPLSEHPLDINIKLKNHQLAMLHKCKEIENIEDNIFGIMSDKPSTGKTYVMLALLQRIPGGLVPDVDSLDAENPSDFLESGACERLRELTAEKKTSIIVVPQNIYTQWILSIETFDKNMKYKKLIEYSDIISLYNDPKFLKDSDIIITTSSYYHIIATTLNSLDIKISRVIFDEIDSISNIIKTKINTDFIWFISASFNKSYLGYYTNKILDDNFDSITCKCSDEFIDANLFLDEPSKKYYLCKNVYIDHILTNIVSKKEMINLNAMDYTLSSYNNNAEQQKATSEKEVVELILKNKKSMLEFEKYKVEDANKNIAFYTEFQDNAEKYKTEYQSVMNKVSDINEFKKNIIDLLQNFNQYTDFYLNFNIKQELENVNVDINKIENQLDSSHVISIEMENLEKELKKEDLKNFHYTLENIIEQLYNINDITSILNDYYTQKLNKSNIENLTVNLKKILMLMENINNVILKVKIEMKKSNIEIAEINIFYKSFLQTKNYFEEINLAISNFKNTIQSKEQIDNYNKILEISSKIIEDSNKKIDLIYDRLKANDCCPICYELFDDIHNNNQDREDNNENLNSNLVYISSSCCNNKICGICVDNWYSKICEKDPSNNENNANQENVENINNINNNSNKYKTSCIFCNTENITKDKMHSYKINDDINNIDNINNINNIDNIDNINDNNIQKKLVNKESKVQASIVFDNINIGKNTYIKNFIETLKNEDRKVIIFSDYSNIFHYIEKICIENEIIYIDLDKGNLKEIDSAVQEYKYGNAKILLSNSSLFGCGMNFENSTDIIFVHKMKSEMEQQVIGRAQRIGRKTRLNVFYLQYENEIELDESTKENYSNNDIHNLDNLEDFYNEKKIYYSLENLANLENIEGLDNIESTYIDNTLPVPDYDNQIIDINLDELIANLH
jgi:hypothetical protein